MHESGGGPLQGDPPEEEDREHQVGEQGREVDDLTGGGDTLDR